MGVRKKLILLGLVLCNVVEQPTPEVTLEQGVVRGRVSSDGLLFEYMGIPYAVANETNRFQPPLSPPRWQGVYDAVNEHYRCPQRFGRFMMGQEDCLKLNVYTQSSPQKLLPVMVFVHGGGYYENSASPSIYGADYFVRHGVIVVTFNYRLGALGFLCLRIKKAPGNIGLRDQLAALKWVQKNIRAFGGDPDNVTVFGESAGGSSIAFIKLTSLARGLFKRAIIQSGSSLGSWSIDSDPVSSARKFAKQIGCDTSEPHELLKCFKKATVEELVTTQVPVINTSIVTSRLIFIPCIETELKEVDTIIAEHPYNLLSSKRYTDVPLLSGINDREGIFLTAYETAESLAAKDKSTQLPSNLKFDSDEIRLGVFKQVRELYFGNKSINKDTIINLADLYSDISFIMPTIFEANMYATTSNNHIYNYVFKYSGYRNVVKYLSGLRKETGASHADELFYMYRSKLLPGVFGQDKVILDRLTTLWTNFAKFGSPTPETTDLLPVTWSPSEANKLKFLHIDEELEMGDVPFPERTKFWNETYLKFRRKY